MNFCIIKGRKLSNIYKTTQVEFEQRNTRSIANFKNFIFNADIISKIDVRPLANPNVYYNILSDIITTAKAKHNYLNNKKTTLENFKKQPWMTDDLLKLVN